jgi:hypothetical protein
MLVFFNFFYRRHFPMWGRFGSVVAMESDLTSPQSGGTNYLQTVRRGGDLYRGPVQFCECPRAGGQTISSAGWNPEDG